MKRWLPLLLIVGTTGCASMTAPTAAQQRVYTAFALCKERAPGITLTHVASNGRWDARSAGSSDGIFFADCMRRQTDGTVWMR